VTVAIGGQDWAKTDARALITSPLDARPQAAVSRESEARRRISSPEVQTIADRPPETPGTSEWR